MAELPEGTVFAGHRIDGVAGRGGMGVVYRARHLALDHVVALKVIAPGLADDPKFRERFVRESRTAVSIRHPNVVQVRHAGEEGGVLFVTMDYIDGSDLRALISAERRLEPARVARIIGQVAAALDAAHARGLVHRDVKPGNVLIEGVGRHEHVFLTDFGLTKRMSGATELTASGAFIGTLEYMAPEQIRGGELDARTDVYALGGVAFAALTGEPPFGQVEGDVAKLYAHLNDPVPRASERAPELPAVADQVLQRAMAKNPDERYDSAGELAAALAEATEGATAAPTVAAAVAPAEQTAERAPTEATEPGAKPTHPAAPPTRLEPTSPIRAGRDENRRRVLGAVAGLVVVALVVGAFALLGGGGEDDPATGDSGGDTAPEVSIGAPVKIGDFTLGVAAKAGTVLVADRGEDAVGVVDERSGSHEVVPAGIEPESVFAGEPIVWVANRGGSISRFDLAGGKLTPESRRPTIELGGTPQDVAVANQAAWVTNATEGSVSRVDPSTGEVAENSIEVGNEPYGVAVHPDNPDIVFVVNGRSNNVSVINRESRTELEAGSEFDTIDVGLRPKAVAIDFGSAWVTNRDSDSVSRIATTDPFPVSTIEDVCTQPRDVTPGFGAIWVSCAERVVARIDPESEDASRIDLGDLRGSPEGIAAGTEAVWVAMGDAGTVVPITPSE